MHPKYLKKAKPLDGLLRERPDLPDPNPVRPGPGPEDRMRNLQRRFRAVSARHDRAIKLRRGMIKLRRGMIKLRRGMMAVLAAIVAFAVVWGLSSSPWPVTTTLRHIASAPNCGFARVVGLAPAKKGEPGYWKRHDRDGDGIACEPWPPQRGRISNQRRSEARAPGAMAAAHVWPRRTTVWREITTRPL